MFKKFVSLFTAGAFLYSFIAAPCVQGAIDLAGVSRDAAQARAALSLSVPAYGLDISPANGRITDVRDFGSGPLVINIQDLHCHPEVQRNIAAILGQVERSFGKSPAQRRVRVHVEGGYGTVDTSWINDIKDPAVRAQVMDALVNDGRLTGTELYSMTTGRSTMLAGLEDEKLHKANIVRLGRMLESKPRFEKELATLKTELGRMQARHFTGQNKRLSRIIEKHRSGKLSSGAYHALLAKYIEKITRSPRSYNNTFSLSIDQYPNIKLHLALSELSKGMNYRQVSTQMQKFMQNLKGAMSFSEYNALLEQTQNFKDMDRLYVSLASALSAPGNGKPWAAAAKRDLSRYGALQKFFAYVLINQKINPVQLVREDRLLVEELRTAFSRSVPELEVAFLVDFFDCFDEYLLNRLSAADYQYFQDRFAKFQSTWGKYTFRNRIKDLADTFSLLDAYYAVNAQRNNVFMKAAAAPLAGSSRDVAVIVSGGFHTEGLTNLLVSKKISYVTITPNVTQDTSPAGTTYQRLAREQAQAFGSQALQLALGSYGAKVISATDREVVVAIDGQELKLQFNGSTFTDITKLQAVIESREGAAEFSAEAFHAAVSESYKNIVALANPNAPAIILALGQAVIESGSTLAWWGGSGLIWRIASDTTMQQKLVDQGYDLNELAQLPVFLQRARAETAGTYTSLLARAKNNPFLTALLMGSLKDIVAPLITRTVDESLRPDAVTPQTQVLGERLGLNARTIRLAFAPVWENFRMLLRPSTFGAGHVQYSETAQQTLTNQLAKRTAITAGMVGALAVIAVGLGTNVLLPGLGAGILAWYTTGVLGHFLWNLLNPSLPATMGAYRAKPGALLQINALAEGARLEGKTLVPGTAAQLKKQLPALIKAGYKEIYLVGLPQRGVVATRMAQGDRKDREPYVGTYDTGETRIVVRTAWAGVEGDLGVKYPNPERARQYITGSPFGSASVTGVDPEWGTQEDLQEISDMLRAKGGRLIVDVVPNHIGIDNTWIDGVTEMDGRKIPNWEATVHINPNELVRRSIVDLDRMLEYQQISGEEYNRRKNSLLGQQQELAKLSDEELFDVSDGSVLRAKCPDIHAGVTYVLNERGMKDEVLRGIPRYAVYYTRPGDRSSRVLIAHGKDPFCPAWEDTLQMDFTHPLARKFVFDNIEYWAKKGISVRMDMSHLLNRYWFMRTWYPNSAHFTSESDRDHSRADWQLQSFYSERWPTEFWADVAKNIVNKYPDFTMLMEAYQDLGILRNLHSRIRVYEKGGFFDTLRDGNIGGLRLYLRFLQNSGIKNLAHFLQNHDEEGLWFKGDEFMKVATALMVTIPGLPFIHGPARHGLDRFKIQVLRPTQGQPVPGMEEFTDAMAAIGADPLFREGKFELIDTNNPNILVYSREYQGRRVLVAVNISDWGQDAKFIPLPHTWAPKNGKFLRFKDAYFPYKTSENVKRTGRDDQEPVYYRSRNELKDFGVKLGAHDAHIFFVEEVSEEQMRSETQNPLLFMGMMGDEDISAYEESRGETIADFKTWQGFLTAQNRLRAFKAQSPDEQLRIIRAMNDYLPIWRAVRSQARTYTDLNADQQAMLREGLGMVRCTDLESIQKAYNKLVNIHRLRAPPGGMLLGILPRNFENDDAIVQFVEEHPGASWVYPVAVNQGTPFEVNDTHAAYSGTFRNLVDRLHGIGRRVMVDAVVNHMGIASKLLDERPELFEYAGLPGNEQENFKAVVEQLAAEPDSEVREAARMTLNTLPELADALMKQERKDHPQDSWDPYDTNRMKDRMYFFDPNRVAENIEGLIAQNCANPGKRDTVRELLVRDGLLSKFLAVDKSVAGVQLAWDAELFGFSGAIPNTFLRIQYDEKTNGYKGVVFRHGSDKVTGGNSCWTNTVQLNWGGNTAVVRDFIIELLLFWQTTYNVDGFRIDAGHWLTQNEQTRAVLKEIGQRVQEKVQETDKNKTIQFIVETYINTSYIKNEAGMLAYLFQFNESIHAFLEGRKDYLVGLLKTGAIPAGVAFIQSHDDSQGKSLVKRLSKRGQEESRVLEDAAIAKFLLAVSGAGLVYVNGDETFKESARLMEFSDAWLKGEAYGYLKALESRLEALNVEYDFMRNNSQHMFNVQEGNMVAGAKWDDNHVVVWAVGSNSGAGEQHGHISAKELERDYNGRWDLPAKARFDEDAIYRVRDLITGVEYRPRSGRAILHDGIDIYLTKKPGQGEMLASSKELRSPPFQMLIYEKIEDPASAQEARVESLRGGVVAVDGMSGYVCGKDMHHIYVAASRHGLPSNQETIRVDFYNDISADIDPQEILSAGEDMVVVAVPIDSLFSKRDSADGIRPVWHEDRVNMAHTIRALHTTLKKPDARETVLIISGQHEHLTVLPIPLQNLTLPVDNSARPKFEQTDFGSPIFFNGRVVGILAGTEADGSYKIISAESIVPSLQKNIPLTALGAFIEPDAISLTDDAAVLPRNVRRITRAAYAEGATAFRVSGLAALIEFPASMMAALGIGSFVKDHGARNAGAKKLVAATRVGMGIGAGLGMALGLALFGGGLAAAAVTVAAALLGSAATNLVVHMQIDYVVAKDLVSAVKQYGNARLENGVVDLTVTIVDTLPEKRDGITPVLITKTSGGEEIWGMVTNAGHAVLYSKALPADVTRALTEPMLGLDRFKGGVPVAERLRAILIQAQETRTDIHEDSRKELVAAVRRAVMGTAAVRIETRTTGKRARYDNDGVMVLTGDMPPAFIQQARAISIGDAVAVGNNTLLYVPADRGGEESNINKTVEALFALSGKQVVVDSIETARKVQGALAKKSRMQIYAMITPDQLQDAFRSGIAGCVVRNADGKYGLVDFATADPARLQEAMISADLIVAADKAAGEIKETIRNSTAQCHILDVSQLAGLIAGNRDITDKQDLVDILGSRVLSLFSVNAYSPRFVRDAVYGFDPGQLTLETKNAYLAKMKADLANDATYNDMESAFNQAWDERQKAEQWIDQRYSSTISLRHRQMIGRVVARAGQKAWKVQVVDSNIPPLSDENISLTYRAAVDNPTPQAISDLIAMIEMFDVKFMGDVDQAVTPQDMQAVAAILGAA